MISLLIYIVLLPNHTAVKPENLFDSVQIGVSILSLKKEGAKIKSHKCFIIKYGHHPRQTTEDDFLYSVSTS